MDIRDDGDETVFFAQFGDNILEIGRVLDSGGGDPHQLAADRHEVEGLAHGQRSVHRVAREHRLDNDGVVATDNDAPATRIANDDFARFSPLKAKWRRAVAHDYLAGAGSGSVAGAFVGAGWDSPAGPPIWFSCWNIARNSLKRWISLNETNSMNEMSSTAKAVVAYS